MKKIISMLLVSAMSLSIATVSFAAEINFSDVKKDDWFYDDVQTVAEMGLINGKSDDRYAPDDNLTYAEAIKLAACMHQLYTSGTVTLTNGNPWYQSYVDYCFEKGIIDKTYNYGEKATRAGYMTIFAKALPDEALKEINNIPDSSIPDVPSDKDYAAAVYKLYRAGILNGIDDAHNCEPLINISRKEVAVIVARMMNEEKRTHFTTVSVDSEQSEKENAEPDNTEQDEALEYVDNVYTTYEALIFSKTPSDVSVDCGETATFQTEVLGGRKPFTYRWQYLEDGSWIDFEDTADEKTTVTGAAETTLTVKTSIPTVTELRCVVTDSVGKEHETPTVKLVVNAILSTNEWSNVGTYTPSGDDADDVDDKVDDKDSSEDNIISSEETVKIESAELKIETQPNDVSIAVEKTAKFTVAVSGGTTPYSYQWQLQAVIAGKRSKWLDLKDNESALSGTKTETLSVTGTSEGEMLLRCVITDDNGNKVTTATVKLTVKENKIVLPSRKDLSGVIGR